MSWFVPLYYFCSFAGLVMVVGGIWLVYKEKLVIDRESKQVTEIDTPLGKFKTNIPALVLFALGFVPLIFPIVKSVGYSSQMNIRGDVTSDAHPVTIYAVVRTDALQQDGEYSLQVPAPFGKAEGDYRVIYVAGGTILEERVDPAHLQSGVVRMRAKVFSAPGTTEYVSEIKDVPDEFK
jgi:hypothetical protein